MARLVSFYSLLGSSIITLIAYPNQYNSRREYLFFLLFASHLKGSGPPRDRTFRETELKSISTALYAFMAVLAMIGVLLGIAFLLINFLYRERRWLWTKVLS